MTTKISGDNISAIANTGVTWNAVTVADGSTTLNASAGNGYILDTNTGVIEVFLPSSPTRGDTVILVDYAGTFATNNVIVNTGTTNLDSTTTRQYYLTTNDTIAEFVYIDSTKGWITRINTTAGTTPSGVFTNGVYDTDAKFISATGGTITESGDFKIHTFTGDGCFVVSCGGNPLGSTQVDYLVVAGGGGATGSYNGGGGAGGFRESHSTPVSGCYTASPLATPTGITISATTYPITVGGGGGAPGGTNVRGNPGSNSVFSTITSTGGGGSGAGAGNPCGVPVPDGEGQPGGSGGGGGGYGPGTRPGGSGNTPPVSPPQGNNGGTATSPAAGLSSAGGGGAGTTGASVTNPGSPGIAGGAGGNGVATLINPATGQPSGCTQYYSGGGGGGAFEGTGGTGGLGGGANGLNVNAPGTANGTANTGGGGGGGGPAGQTNQGGKGIVIIRYKFQ